MAKNSQTFNASIRLNTTQFKKGINEVQRSLKSLQSTFLSVAGALGLGLSFGKLGSSLLDTATKLSTAKNVLENVSKEFGEYGQNLEWLKRISNEYGQDMITLINSFAQFRAAASSSNLSLEQMRNIYESLTRAAGAFHLSADRTNDMMMAVTQMLSKGKVSAEELRRQLGNVLPGAFNLMAQAAYDAGITTENTTAALEDAMKKGKVISEQVLPSFAKQLDIVTEGANFDSLQTSMNRLKNSWTEMVEEANFEGLYKGIIDAANKVVQYFTSGFWTKISTAIAGVFGATVVTRGIKNFRTSVNKTVTEVETEYNHLYSSLMNQDKQLGKLKGFNEAVTHYGKGKSVGGSQGTLMGSGYLVNGDVLEKLNLSEKEIVSLSKAVRTYNEDLLKLSKAQKQLTGEPFFKPKTTAVLAEHSKYLKELEESLSGTGSAFEDLNGKANIFSTIGAKLTAAWKSFVGILKSAFASIAIGAIISGVTYLVGKLVEARKEEKRIAGIADEIKSSVENVSVAENKTVVQLTILKKAWKDVNESTNEALGGKKQEILDEINNALGRTGKNLLTLKSGYDEVISAVDDYIDSLKKAAVQQAILTVVGEKTTRLIQLQAENKALEADPNYNKKEHYYTGSVYSPLGGSVSETENLTVEAQKVQGKIDKNNDEIAQLNKGIKDVLEMANEDTLKAIYGGKETVSGRTSGNTSGDTGGTKDTPQAALNKYKEELQKLENQYKAGAILAEDYKKKVEELNQKSFEELSAFGWDEAMKGLASSADKALAEELKKTATAKLLEGLDDPEAIAEFDKALQDEADNALKKFQEAWKKFLEYRKKTPLIGEVDTSDSYMYSRKSGKGQSYSELETHYNGEYLDVYEKYVDDLENYKQELINAMNEVTDPATLKRFNELLQETIDKLALAKLTVKDLKTKANIAELEKEISDLKKEGLDNIFTSITSIADGMDRLYRAVQAIQQINDETWQSEELEKFLKGLNAIIQVFEVMKSLIQAVTAVTQVYSKIKEKSAMKAIALNGAEAASESAKASAAGAAAAAGAGSSVASIPFVGPALAVAAIASVVAALTLAVSKLHKFAGGGLVGGNSYTGDKQLVRVNSGEMILNKQQQANLLALANGKGKGSGGSVDFRIRGTDLVGVLNNEMSRRRG